MAAVCDCGSPLPPRSGRGAQRKKCLTCSPSRARKVTELPPPVSAGTADAVRAELEAAGRSDTSLGRAAVVLAERVDSGQDAGSGLAALVKQLSVTLGEALEGSAAASPLDELRERRERRRA